MTPERSTSSCSANNGGGGRRRQQRRVPAELRLGKIVPFRGIQFPAGGQQQKPPGPAGPLPDERGGGPGNNRFSFRGPPVRPAAHPQSQREEPGRKDLWEYRVFTQSWDNRYESEFGADRTRVEGHGAELSSAGRRETISSWPGFSSPMISSTAQKRAEQPDEGQSSSRTPGGSGGTWSSSPACAGTRAPITDPPSPRGST